MLPTRRKDSSDRTRRCVKPTAPAPHALGPLHMALRFSLRAYTTVARISLPPVSVPLRVVCPDASRSHPGC